MDYNILGVYIGVPDEGKLPNLAQQEFLSS